MALPSLQDVAALRAGVTDRENDVAGQLVFDVGVVLRDLSVPEVLGLVKERPREGRKASAEFYQKFINPSEMLVTVPPGPQAGMPPDGVATGQPPN